MNTYNNYQNDFNYQTNMLPNEMYNIPQSAMQDNTVGKGKYPHYMTDNKNVNMNGYSTINLYDPYEGFIRGNLFPQLYDQYKLNRPFEIKPLNEQAELLTNYDALCFATIDLSIYLDVHPEDRTAIELFNNYQNEKKQLLKHYESKYGPLTLDSEALNTYPWAWDNKPWPWEN